MSDVASAEDSVAIYRPLGGDSALVSRSSVPALQDYGEYRPYLRYDFYFACAYCTTTEAEAWAVRFTIDHYEPRSVRPDLVNEYSNLMWSCDVCNMRKSDRTPPANAREKGFRFFRPDIDRYCDHFASNGERLKELSPIGYFSLEALDLNRLALRRLRGLRRRLFDCDRYVAEGIAALRRTRIDNLPKNIVKSKVVASIQKADKMAEKLADSLDDLLRDFAKSPLLDEDPEATQRLQERGTKLKDLEAMYPGIWRARRAKRSGP